MAKNMSKEEAYNFIDSKPGWANLCTIGKDGFLTQLPLAISGTRTPSTWVVEMQLKKLGI